MVAQTKIQKRTLLLSELLIYKIKQDQSYVPYTLENTHEDFLYFCKCKLKDITPEYMSLNDMIEIVKTYLYDEFKKHLQKQDELNEQISKNE